MLKSLFNEQLSLFGTSYLDRFVHWIGWKANWARRALFWVGLTWVPLLGFSLLEKSQTIELPFIRDFPVHIRFLLGIPILILGERFVEARLKDVVPIFVERGMIASENTALIATIITRVRALSATWIADILILIASISIVQSHELIDLSTRFTSWKTADTRIALFANTWYQWVSLIIYHLILLRWVWKYFIWLYFLFRMAGSGLILQSHHPDQRGGLMFILARHITFGVMLLAVSLVMSGNIGGMVAFGGHDLLDYRSAVITYMILAILIYLIPLCVFTPLLVRTKREGLRVYGRFAARHSIDFEKRWDRISAIEGTSPLGAHEISSNADLDTSFINLYEMRFMLMNRRYLAGIACFAVLPFFPLILFKVPLAEILARLAKMVV